MYTLNICIVKGFFELECKELIFSDISIFSHILGGLNMLENSWNCTKFNCSGHTCIYWFQPLMWQNYLLVPPKMQPWGYFHLHVWNLGRCVSDRDRQKKSLGEMTSTQQQVNHSEFCGHSLYSFMYFNEFLLQISSNWLQVFFEWSSHGSVPNFDISPQERKLL